MTHFLTLIYKISINEEQYESIQEINLSAKSASLDFLRMDIQRKLDLSNVLKEILITIGKKISWTTGNQEIKGADFILSRLFDILNYLKKEKLLHSLEKIAISINHYTFSVATPFLQWIKDIPELQIFELETVQPFTEQQSTSLLFILTQKLKSVKKILLSATLTKDTQQTYLEKEQICLREFTLLLTNQRYNIEILKQFPNIQVLSLEFSIYSKDTFIEQTIQKLPILSPRVSQLKLKILHFFTLKTEFDFAKLTELFDLQIECPDPLSLFLKLKNQTNIQRLSLYNIEGDSSSSKSETKNEVEKLKNSLVQQKHLNYLSISNFGNQSHLLDLMKKYIEITFNVACTLKEMEINLFSSNLGIGKQIDLETVHFLCKLLGQCKQGMRVNYTFETSLMSVQGKCDLAQSIRRLPSIELFSLNGILPLEKIRQSKKSFIELKENSDNSFFLLKIGYLGASEDLRNKRIDFSEKEIQVMKKIMEGGDQKLITQLKELLYPFERVSIDSYQLSIPLPLSPNLSTICFFQSISHKIIDDVISQFPKLLEIDADIYDILQMVQQKEFPKRLLTLRIPQLLYGLDVQNQIFQVRGHYFKIYAKRDLFSPKLTMDFIQKLADLNHRFLFFNYQSKFRQSISNQNSPNSTIFQYSVSIELQILQAAAFNKIIRDLLPINPSLVYIDHYFD